MYFKTILLLAVLSFSYFANAQEDYKIYKSSITFNKVTQEGIEKVNAISESDKSDVSVTFSKTISQEGFDLACKKLSWVKEIRIRMGVKLDNLNGLSKLDQLESLSLSNVIQKDKKPFSLKPLKKCSELKELSIIFTKVNESKYLSSCSKLEEVTLEYSAIDDLEWLRDKQNLETLSLKEDERAGFTDFSPIASLNNLASLTLIELPQATNESLNSLLGMNSLEDFTFEQNSKVTNLNFLAQSKNLESIELSEMENLNDISALKNLTELEEVSFYEVNITSLSGLEGCSSLIELYLEIVPVKDLSPLSNLPAIEYIVLGETEVTDISPLYGLKTLTDLEIGEDVPDEQVTEIENRISDISVSTF